MEFISAVLSYFLVCTLLWALYQFRHISLLSPLTRGVKTLFKVVIFCLPRDLYRRIGGILDWILFSRHCLFQVLYLLLLLIGHVTLVNDVIAVLYRFGEAGNHVFTAFSCLFLNLASYALVCWSDPGYITSRNLPALANFFPYDNVLHTPRYCSDCLHLIPARAKHCGRCEQCIFRFEHHCVWTNCCIGGQNYVYFLGFLVTLVAMLANAVWQGVRLLSVFTRTHHLWDAQVVDFSGQLVAMHWSALVQHLFMTLPRVVAMVSILGLVTLVVAGYLCFHVWLVVTNQTTYEYGLLARKDSSSSCFSGDRGRDAINRSSGLLRRDFPGAQGRTMGRRWDCRFYDRGLWWNISEALGLRSHCVVRQLRHRLPAQMEFKTL